MRVAWELVAALRMSLLSLEERATRVVPAEVAALIALWSQMHSFDRTSAKIAIWAAWSTLVVAVISLSRIVMPRRLEQFWDSLVPPEVVLGELKPLEPCAEGALAAHMSEALHTQIDQLRRRFRVTVAISVFALVLTAVAYCIQHW
jgi:hypothetical protein